LLVITNIFCTAEFNDSTRKITVVLPDLSESTNRLETRREYSNAFSKILEKVNYGDAIVVSRISDFSLKESRLPIQENIPVFKPRYKSKIYAIAEERTAFDRLRKKKNQIQIIMDSILFESKRKILRTDIISSLQVAERIFNSYCQQKKVLVIMSDMIEDSKDYNFAKDILTEIHIENIIEQEKRKDRLPNLCGVKVYVVGAGGSTLDQYHGIQNFWLRFFKECGAILLKRDYGSGLILFHE